MSKDPYMLKAEWMIKADEEEILTFFRNRLVYSKYMGLPVDEARGEKPEDFLVWVYQHEDRAFKEKFASGLVKLMNELFEQVRQGHKDRLDPLSGVLHIVSQCCIVEAAKLLQENLIESDHLNSFADSLHHLEGKYTVCMLHQALLTLAILESFIDKPSRVLSRPFWEGILENDNFKDFRGLAIRGLGYQNWQFALKQLPLFIDELMENSGQEHPDDLMFSLASAFNFLFEQLKIEYELSPGNVDRVHIDLFIDEKIRKSLCDYRYKKQSGDVLDLVERTLTYLNDRHEFSEKRALIDRAAELIHFLPDAVRLNTTASLIVLGNKREPVKEKYDPIGIIRWVEGRLEIKQERRYTLIGCVA